MRFAAFFALGFSLLACQPSLESRLEEARELVFRQRSEEAIAAYRSLLYALEGVEGESAQKARIEALSRIGDLSYLEKRDVKGAAEAYRTLIRIAPSAEEAYWAREKLAEIAHRHFKDLPEAIAQWQVLATSGREGAEQFAYRVAKAYFESRDYEQSRKECESIVQAFPEGKVAQDALFLLATSYQFEGKYEDAIAAFERVEARWPGSEIAARARFQKGRARMSSGDPDGALADYLDALKTHPDPERVQAEIARARRYVAELERIRRGGPRAAFQG